MSGKRAIFQNLLLLFGGLAAAVLICEAALLRQYAETRGIFLHGFEGHPPGTGHWNAEGHRAAGTFIANYICRLE